MLRLKLEKTVYSPIQETIEYTVNDSKKLWIIHQNAFIGIHKCNCDMARKRGLECQHLKFVYKTVAEHISHASNTLLWQLALERINPNAPSVSIVSTVKKSIGRKEYKEKDECPICYEELGPDIKATLWCQKQCGSSFHDRCLLNYFGNLPSHEKQRCPLCRADFTILS